MKTVFVCYYRDEDYTSIPIRVFLNEQDAKDWVLEDYENVSHYVEIEIG